MDGVKLSQKLIQIPSFSGQEKRLADFILDYCVKNNLPAKFQDGNVVVYLKGKKQQKALIFNAHMDTVGVGDKNSWKYPPVGKKAGKIINGKIYGLGASDNKVAIVTMLLLAKSLNNPPHDIWFTFVCNEETDGTGTKNFLEWFSESKNFDKYQELAVVIGEPTNLTNIEIGHRGNAFIKLTANGTSGHGAKDYPPSDLAVNNMLKSLEKLQKISKSWEKKYQDKILGKPTFNITSIHTKGDGLNKIPNQCVATLDIRTTPKLHEKLEKLLKTSIGGKIKISLIKEKSPPGVTRMKSKFIEIWKKILPKANISISVGSTDLSQFAKKNIDTVVFGPGSKEVIHKENEYVYISDIEKALEIYKKVIFTKA